jgi:hypothetical protein
MKSPEADGSTPASTASGPEGFPAPRAKLPPRSSAPGPDNVLAPARHIWSSLKPPPPGQAVRSGTHDVGRVVARTRRAGEELGADLVRGVRGPGQPRRSGGARSAGCSRHPGRSLGAELCQVERHLLLLAGCRTHHDDTGALLLAQDGRVARRHAGHAHRRSKGREQPHRADLRRRESPGSESSVKPVIVLAWPARACPPTPRNASDLRRAWRRRDHRRSRPREPGPRRGSSPR